MQEQRRLAARSGRELVAVRSPLRLRLVVASFALGFGIAAAIAFGQEGRSDLVTAGVIIAVIGCVSLAGVIVALRRGLDF